MRSESSLSIITISGKKFLGNSIPERVILAITLKTRPVYSPISRFKMPLVRVPAFLLSPVKYGCRDQALPTQYVECAKDNKGDDVASRSMLTPVFDSKQRFKAYGRRGRQPFAGRCIHEHNYCLLLGSSRYVSSCFPTAIRTIAGR